MSRKAKGFGALEERIGHTFSDMSLLERALTHVSAIADSRNRAGSYQRLEFLGDHVLGLVIAEMVYRAFPKAEEGELSRRLADLVRRETCAEVARTMELGPVMILGPSEAQGGGRKRTAMLADACEALIGAVYLDGGYEKVAKLIDQYWRERMIKPSRPLRDSKTMLQEWAQGQGLPVPVYRELERTGPHHSPEFRIVVEVLAKEPTEGTGRSKRAAEQAAAAAMLARECQSEPDSDE